LEGEFTPELERLCAEIASASPDDFAALRFETLVAAVTEGAEEPEMREIGFLDEAPRRVSITITCLRDHRAQILQELNKLRERYVDLNIHY